MSQTLTKGEVQITSPPVLRSTELVSKLISAGLAACVAEAITLPMDTAKIKLQVSFPLILNGLPLYFTLLL